MIKKLSPLFMSREFEHQARLSENNEFTDDYNDIDSS